MANQNMRIIEKNIFDLGASETGDSEIIDLNGASKFSCQAIYDVISPSAKTFDSGRAEVDTFTFTTKVGTSSGDYMVVYDTTGLAWAAAADLTGSDPAPTGAIWAAIPSGRKTLVNLSLATTAATVATAFKTALNLLTSVPFVAADSTANVACTQNIRGPVTAPSVHNANDSGAGSISVVVTTAGVVSEVDVTLNTLAIPSHSFYTGLKIQLTSTGTLPAPFLTATDYFVIVVDANTIQLATTLVNAVAGTAINITDQGSNGAVNTVTAVALAGASVTFRCSNDATNWVDVQAATSITVDGSTMLSQPNVAYRYFKAVKALTAGAVDLSALILVIGDGE
jgi:hypothetical protein